MKKNNAKRIKLDVLEEKLHPSKGDEFEVLQ